LNHQRQKKPFGKLFKACYVALLELCRGIKKGFLVLLQWGGHGPPGGIPTAYMGSSLDGDFKDCKVIKEA